MSIFTEIETILKILALIGAGGFFLWKAFTGWLIINLKLSLKLERTPQSSEFDYLAITVLLEKGNTDSIWLQNVSAKVDTFPPQVEAEVMNFSEELRWLRVDLNRVIWGEYIQPNRDIALSPGESTTIARVTVVPSDKPALVEVAAYGRRDFWPRGFQWRASAVALPISEHKSVTIAADGKNT